MATITVPAAGLLVSGVTLDDVLQPGSDVDPNGVAYYEVDGASTLRSLYVGSSIEVLLGFLASATLTGTGSITGANDSTVRLPVLSNYGDLDIDGAIDIGFYNNGRLVVSAGERLAIEGDLYSLSASTITVAPNAELDIDSLATAIAGSLSSQGTLKLTAPNTLLSGPTTLAGTVLVQGDALNAQGSGTAIPRPTPAYVATLDLRSAIFAAPIDDLTLGRDAQIRFGTTPTTIGRLVVAGDPAASVPLDVVNLDGTVTIIGDRSGAARPVSVSQAEFAGAGTIAFAVAAAQGGATLQQAIAIDAGTTLRNDATMTIGASSSPAATTIGAASAAAGSTLVNGSAGQLTIQGGATIGVAAVQNAGAITVAATTSIVQPLLNTGTIDITAGTLMLAGPSQGAGTITVENGATLSLGAASAGGIVALRTGATLRLALPTSFASTIQAPAIGAQIDLAGIAATAATVANGSIAITTASTSFGLAETGLADGTALAIGSDGAGGTLLTVTAPTIVTGTPSPGLTHPAVYRFFDNIHGTHFFTASLTETQSLQASSGSLVFEGIGLNAVDPATDSAATPVYRFFDTKFGTHFYTSSTAERDDIAANRTDLTDEGIGFYEHATAQPGDTAVYRFFDRNFGTHFYTADPGERATIIATRSDLVSEGIGFYAPSS